MGLRTFALRCLTARRTQRTRTATAAGRKERSREQAHFLGAQTFSFPSAAPRYTTPKPQNNAPRLQAWCMVSTSGRFAKLRGCNVSSLHLLFILYRKRSRYLPAPFCILRLRPSRASGKHAPASRQCQPRHFCAVSGRQPAACAAQAAEQHIFIFCAFC